MTVIVCDKCQNELFDLATVKEEELEKHTSRLLTGWRSSVIGLCVCLCVCVFVYVCVCVCVLCVCVCELGSTQVVF